MVTGGVHKVLYKKGTFVASPCHQQDGPRPTSMDEIKFLGSPDSSLVEKDFTKEQRRDFAIRKEIIWESDTASDSEVYLKKVEYIDVFKSNDPAIGYNQWPKFRG
jgi:hypothetical protein